MVRKYIMFTMMKQKHEILLLFFGNTDIKENDISKRISNFSAIYSFISRTTFSFPS